MEDSLTTGNHFSKTAYAICSKVRGFGTSWQFYSDLEGILLKMQEILFSGSHLFQLLFSHSVGPVA